jgi:G6PDH family F420-dependent oxidoreductase
MLEEAIEVIRELWTGELVSHEGKHYTVENARLYSFPDQPPPIYVAAAGEKALELAGRAGDGLICLTPEEGMIEQFEESGGRGKPKLAEMTVCWAEDEQRAVKTALERWPIVGLGGELTQELPLPRHFEQAAGSVTEEAIAQAIPCGPDHKRHLESIREYEDAGYDHIWVHQIGPDQEGFFRFFREEVLPEVR